MAQFDAFAKYKDGGGNAAAPVPSGGQFDAFGKYAAGGGSAASAPAPTAASGSPSGGSAFDPVVARDEKESWLVSALSAGSRAGKHLVATGELGVPDRQGEEDDRATIRQRLHLDSLPHPVQGVVDFGIDTALDPTTYIPGGALLKGGKAIVGPGSRAVGTVGKAALDRSPQIVKDAAGVVGDVGKKLVDLNKWGGDAHRSLSAEEMQNAALQDNVRGFRQQELTRRLLLQHSGIFDGLSDSEKFSAFRMINGEVDITSSHAANEAAKRGRKLLDDSGHIQGNEGFRSILEHGAPKVANDKFVQPQKKADISKTDLFRYQRSAEGPEISPLRGGTFFTMGMPAEGYKRSGRAGTGGQNLIERVASARNPLDLRGANPTELPLDPSAYVKGVNASHIGRMIGIQAAEVLRPGKPTAENLKRAMQNGDKLTYARYLRALGLSNAEIGNAINSGLASSNSVDDRIAAALASKYGHDAILLDPMPGQRGKGGDAPEFFALHPNAHKGVDAASDFERMVPEEAANPAVVGKLKVKAANLPERKPYEVDSQLAEFAAPAEQGVLGKDNFRRNYLPGVKSTQTVSDGTMRPRPYNLADPFAGHALSRESFTLGEAPTDQQALSETVGSLDAAFKRYLENAATQATAGTMRQNLGIKPGQVSPAMRKLFEVTPRAKGDARNGVEKAQDVLRAPADMTRAMLTSFGLKHGAVNVPTLAGASEGLGPVLKMLPDALAEMRKSPEARYEANKAYGAAGVLSPEYDTRNPILDALKQTPGSVRALGTGAVGGLEGFNTDRGMNPDASPAELALSTAAGAAGGAAIGKALPALGQFSNDLTWALDEAAKKNVYNAKLKRGLSSAEAAGQTLDDTIDYAHRAPLAQALSSWGLAPFATFGTKVPGAVLGSLARDPRRAVLADRASDGLLTNGQLSLPGAGTNDEGNPYTFKMSTPLSETNEAITDLPRYVRTKASDPARMAAAAIAGFASGKPGDFFTGNRAPGNYPMFNKPLLPHMNADGDLKSGYAAQAMANLAPLNAGRTALDTMGLSEYRPQSILDQILGPLLGAFIQ